MGDGFADERGESIGSYVRDNARDDVSFAADSSDLAEPVKAIADPHGRGRQYLATFLSGLAGTHAAGFVLTRQEPAGKWTAATYALNKTAPADSMGYRSHRTYRPDDAADAPSISPMGPMPDDLDGAVSPGAETEI
jgi:hypothetical protein